MAAFVRNKGARSTTRGGASGADAVGRGRGLERGSKGKSRDDAVADITADGDGGDRHGAGCHDGGGGRGQERAGGGRRGLRARMASRCRIRWGRALTAGGNGVALPDSSVRGGNDVDDDWEVRWGGGKGRGTVKPTVDAHSMYSQILLLI